MFARQPSPVQPDRRLLNSYRLCLGLVALIVSVGIGCTAIAVPADPTEGGAPEKTPADGAATGADAGRDDEKKPEGSGGGAASVDAAEAALAERIARGFGRVPQDTTKQSSLPVDQLKKIADATLIDCDEYLKKYPEGPHLVEVLQATTKLLAMNHQRREEGPEAWRAASPAAYYDQILSLIERAAARGLTKDQELRFGRVKGQTCFFAQRYDDAVRLYRDLLERFPEDPERDDMWMALVRSLDDGRRLDEAAAECERFRLARPRSRYAPHVVLSMAKALAEAGKPEEALRVWREHEAFFRAGDEGKPVKIGEEEYVYPADTRDAFATCVEQVDYWIGHLSYIIGDFDETLRRWRDSVAFLTARQEAGRITQIGKVFLMRVTSELAALELVQGKPAPSLDTVLWINGKQLSLEESRGKVVALYFAVDGWDRYHPPAKLLEDYVRDPTQEVRAAWITNSKGKQKVDSQLAEERDQLGLTMPLGIDGTGEREKGAGKWPVHMAYGCQVGGATIVLLDRAGNIAWYKIDPHVRDLELIRYVIRRLLAEKAK